MFEKVVQFSCASNAIRNLLMAYLQVSHRIVKLFSPCAVCICFSSNLIEFSEPRPIAFQSFSISAPFSHIGYSSHTAGATPKYITYK